MSESATMEVHQVRDEVSTNFEVYDLPTEAKTKTTPKGAPVPSVDRYGNRIMYRGQKSDGYLINSRLEVGVFKTATQISAELVKADERNLSTTRCTNHLEYWLKMGFRTGIKMLTHAEDGKEVGYSVNR